MYTALCYVPRGASNPVVPTTPPSRATNVAKEVIARHAANQKNDTDDDGSDDEEVDITEVLADDLNNLAAFPSNKDDPYLKDVPKADAMFDEEERDDLVIRPTDALILACRTDDDVSMLEVHVVEDVFEKDEGDVENKKKGPYAPNTYVHHDLILPAAPLCAQYTQMGIDTEDGKETICNFVAVGMYEYPGIDIWDVDRMDTLLPALTLGGPDMGVLDEDDHEEVQEGKRKKNKEKKVKKRARKPELREGSHTGPVMCLAWHPSQKHYLASGSDDHTVKIWDTRTGDCMTTFEHHSDKVQSVQWHPEEEAIIVTGSFDHTVAVVNVQTSQVLGTHKVDSDIESLHWLSNDNIIAATEKGTVTVLRYAEEKLSQVSQVKAHDAEVSGCVCSPSLPGMVVTGSTDKEIKIWDFRNAESPELVHSMKSNAGAVFGMAMELWRPDGPGGSPFLCAWAGAKGNLILRDLAVVSSKVRTIWSEFLSGPLKELTLARATNSSLSDNKTKMENSEGDDDDNSEDSDSSHDDMT